MLSDDVRIHTVVLARGLHITVSAEHGRRELGQNKLHNNNNNNNNTLVVLFR